MRGTWRGTTIRQQFAGCPATLTALLATIGYAGSNAVGHRPRSFQPCSLARCWVRANDVVITGTSDISVQSVPDPVATTPLTVAIAANTQGQASIAIASGAATDAWGNTSNASPLADVHLGPSSAESQHHRSGHAASRSIQRSVTASEVVTGLTARTSWSPWGPLEH